MSSITIESGSTVRLTTDDMGDRLVIVDHPDAPTDLRHCEVGRVIGGGFQMPFITPPVALSPGILRAIADLIDAGEAQLTDDETDIEPNLAIDAIYDEEFRQELQAVLNRHGLDAAMDMPDFILAGLIQSHLTSDVIKIADGDLDEVLEALAEEATTDD